MVLKEGKLWLFWEFDYTVTTGQQRLKGFL